MAIFPAYCPECGNVFQSRAINLPNMAGLTLSGNRERCPQCGGWAHIADAHVDAATGLLTEIQGGRFSQDQLEALVRIISGASTKSVNEIESAVADIHPDLGKAFSRLNNKGIGLGFILVLIMLAIKQCSFNMNVDVDVNRLMDQVLNTVTDGDSGDLIKNLENGQQTSKANKSPPGSPDKGPRLLPSGMPSQNAPNRQERRRLASVSRRSGHR